MTPSYVPPVEVLSDPNFKYRHIAVTQVEVGDVVNIFPALNALQADEPKRSRNAGAQGGAAAVTYPDLPETLPRKAGVSHATPTRWTDSICAD